MNTLEKVASGLFVAASVTAGVSQIPEAYDCTGPDGKNQTEWSGAEIGSPHCDEAYMSDTGNVVHDVAKGTTLLLLGGACLTGAVVYISRRSTEVARTKG